MNDRLHIQRIRNAIKKLAVARNYHAQVARLVKEAERELESAVKAASAPTPTNGGEKAAA
jgi:hypothetical protein